VGGRECRLRNIRNSILPLSVLFILENFEGDGDREDLVIGRAPTVSLGRDEG
jgi:hypothetical protein